MPAFRHAEYSPQVRRLCQHGAYQRLPFDNDLYINNELVCSRCGKTGSITQKLVFKQGHAGEWVRVCNDCDLVYYPAQPGTPPDLLLRIEAARDTAVSSSTMVTPDSKSSHSSALSTNSHSQPRDISPIGGELEDWLSPLLRDLDMDPPAPQRTSIGLGSGSPEPVAGPSTGPGFGNLRTLPQCARDEEVARMLQAAIDEEDAQVLQQFEESPPESPPKVGNHERKTSTLSSLTAELAAIARTQPPQVEVSPPRVHLHVQNISTPSRCSSPESSPSPRPRKKKRIIVHPTPPPRVRRKFRGPLPQAPSVKVPTKTDTIRSTKLAKFGAAVLSVKRGSEKFTKPSAKTSKADPTHKTRPRSYIIISSGDESEYGTGARTARASQMSPTRPAADDQDSIILIHSSDSEGDSAPLATQPRTPLPRVTVRSSTPSRDFLAARHSARSHSQHGSAPPVIQSRISRSHPTVRSPAPSRDIPATTRPAHDNDDSESVPPPTQPRILRSRPTVRSCVPSRDIETRPAHNDDDRESAPPATQPPTTPSCNLGICTQPSAATVTVSEGKDQDPDPAGSSNKENDIQSVMISVSCLDESVSLRLAARQALARRHAPAFAPLAKSSSPSSSSSSSSSSESDDDVQRDPEPVDRQPAEPQSSSGNAGERVDANKVFGDPFRFELYPLVPELAKITNPDVAKRHWVLTVKIWYKNNAPPSTKMIPLEDPSCCIRLSDFFIIARAFRFTGVTSYRLWNRFTTDWDSHSLYEYLSVSITDNHTLLVRLPTVATLSSWAENTSQAYGPCQTVDPRPVHSRKGKERQHD